MKAKPRSAARRGGGRLRKARLAIVGAGRAGTALALGLARQGWPVAAVAALRLASARTLARRCGARLATTNAATAARAADAVILAVPDRVLPQIARALAASRGPSAGRQGPRRPSIGSPIALHTSGASGASVLAPLRARGWAVGSFHPLLSFKVGSKAPARASDGRSASRFAGATIAIDGDPAARQLARRLAASLGAHPLALPAKGRVRYHLAACFASNYVVTLVWEATRLLEEAGVPRRRTLATLLPLIRSTVANLESAGVSEALTGPVARGDDGTLARHASVLRRGDPLRRELHRLLVERTARLAHESGRIDRPALQRIERALGR